MHRHHITALISIAILVAPFAPQANADRHTHDPAHVPVEPDPSMNTSPPHGPASSAPEEAPVTDDAGNPPALQTPTEPPSDAPSNAQPTPTATSQVPVEEPPTLTQPQAPPAPTTHPTASSQPSDTTLPPPAATPGTTEPTPAVNDPTHDTPSPDKPPTAPSPPTPPLGEQRLATVALPPFVRFHQTRPDTTVTITPGRVEPGHIRDVDDRDVLASLLRLDHNDPLIQHLIDTRNSWETELRTAVAARSAELHRSRTRGQATVHWSPATPLHSDEQLSAVARAAVPPAATRDSIAFPVLGPMWFGNSWGDCRGITCERRHVGTDIIGVRMQPIRAAVDGTIESAHEAIDLRISGARLTIIADDGYRYHYFHLNNDTPGTDDGHAQRHWTFPPTLTPGQRVTAGQIIGYLGDSGNAENSVVHLHFEIRDPAGTPVPSYPILVEAAAREMCNIGLGPWAVLPAAGGEPETTEHITVHPGALGGAWSIDRHGRLTATGAAALVAPTPSCRPESDTFGTDASGWILDQHLELDGYRVRADTYHTVASNRSETRITAMSNS